MSSFLREHSMEDHINTSFLTHHKATGLSDRETAVHIPADESFRARQTYIRAAATPGISCQERLAHAAQFGSAGDSSAIGSAEAQ